MGRDGGVLSDWRKSGKGDQNGDETGWGDMKADRNEYADLAVGSGQTLKWREQ